VSIDDIRTLRNARPFKPFDIVLRDGRRVRVALPERLALAPNGEKLGVYEDIMSTPVEVASIASVALAPLRKRRPRRK
jgi:hypothetical protein